MGDMEEGYVTPMSQRTTSPAVTTMPLRMKRSSCAIFLAFFRSVRRLGTGAFDYEAVVLRPPVGGEVEDIVLVAGAEIEVAAAHAELVLVAVAHRHDLAGGRDDRALPDHVIALLESAFRCADHPGAVLIGAGLHDQVVVEQLEGIEVERVAEPDRRVV